MKINFKNKGVLPVVGIGIIITTLLIILGGIYIKLEKRKTVIATYAELETLTNFKANQVDDWLNERFADATHFSISPLYSDAIFKLISQRDTVQEIKIAQRNELIRKLRGFTDVHIATNKYLLPFSTSIKFKSVPKAIQSLIDSSLQYKEIVLSDIWKDENSEMEYIATVAPIVNAKGEAFASLIFYINPQEFLYKLLQFKPLQNIDLNTLLYQRQSHKINTFNDEKLTFSEEYLSAIKNETPTYYGLFTPNENVYAYIQPLKNAPWVVISQESELFLHEKIKNRIFLIYLGIIILIIIMLFGLTWIYQKYERKLFKNLLDKEQQAVKRIMLSEAKFRAVVENSEGVILFLDADGVIEYCGTSSNTIGGLSQTHIIYTPLVNYISEKEQKRFSEQLNSVLSGKSKVKTAIFRLNCIDDNCNWVEITLNNQLNTEHLNYVVAHIKDINEQKEHEQQIADLLNFKSSILDYAGYGIITTDPDGIITLFNKTSEMMLGFTAEELVGKHTPGVFHVEEEIIQQAKVLSERYNMEVLPQFTTFVLEAQMGKPRQYEWSYKRKDGSIFPVNLLVTALRDSDDHITGYMGIAMDISELKFAEQKSSYFFELSPDVVGITRLEDGLMLDVNNAFTLITGYPKEVVLGKKSTALGLWTSIDERDYITSELKAKGHINNYETHFTLPNGDQLTSLFSARAFNYKGEECMLFITRDISERIKIEKALIAEKTFMNVIFDHFPGLISIYDSSDKLIRWNSKYSSILGYHSDELRGKDYSFFYNEVNKTIIEEAVRTTKKFGSNEVEIPLSTKGGEIKSFYTTATMCDIKGQKYLLNASLDITDKKLANETLLQIERQFLNIYNLSPDMVGITTLNSGKILSANPATSVLTGFSQEEMIGKTTAELHWWANEEDRTTMIKSLKDKKEVANLEIKMRIKGGTILTCLFSARTLIFKKQECLLFVVHDITERKKAEEKIKTNQARLLNAQKLGNIGYSEQILNTSTFWISAIAKQMYGFEAVDGFIEYQKIKQCIPNVNLLSEATKKLLENGDKFDMEFLIHPADNSPSRYIHAIQDIEYDTDGYPYKLISFFQDITERKKIELEIRQLNESLEKRISERTAQLAKVNNDLEAFAYSVSHDLRAPIRHVDGFVKLLYNQIEEPNAQIKNYYHKINTASQRMSVMIDDLLTFSRLGRKDILVSEVNLNKMINEIIDQLTPDISTRNIAWEIATLPPILGDKNLLKIAFENLVFNAVKYTSKKEKAIIEIGIKEIDNNHIELFVKDNGAGFDMAYVDKLFGVFQRLHTNEEFEGTGIGLANVKQIIQKHNGTIKAEGKSGQGAVFFINLPLSK